MSGNRLSWILVAVVVVVVGALVFRTVQRDAATRSETAPSRRQTESGGTPGSRSVAVNPDSIRAARLRTPQLSSVQQAQTVLKERGFYDGPISGSYDPKLAEALKQFQKSVGMKPTGYLDEKTYAALGIQLHGKRK